MRWIIGEQRLCAPALDELLERDVFQFVGQQPVGRAPLGPLALIGDPRRRSDQDQPLDPAGLGERDVQRDAPAIE